MKTQSLISILLCAVLLVAGCADRRASSSDERKAAAWKRYSQAHEAKALERTLAIIDSMEQTKFISAPRANHMRGLAYDQGWQMKIAGHYYKEAYIGYAEDPSQDWYHYGDAGLRWACLSLERGDTDGALDVVTELLSQAETNDSFPKVIQSSLLMLMADVQMQLRQSDQARLSWQRAYEIQQQECADNRRAYLPWLTMNISCALFDMGDIEGAQQWLDRCVQEFADFERVCADSLLLEEWRGHLALKRARYLQATGRSAEAAATYAAVPRRRIFEPHGYMEAAEYLMAAGRYDEAAYWYELTDSTYLATDDARMTLDNIASRLSPRYAAYRKAGRDGDALAIADSVCASIDSALMWQRKSDATELAVIYQTHERDLQLSTLTVQLYLHRLMAVTLAVILLLIAYFLWRAHQYNKVLMQKNRYLYEQIQRREREEKQAIEQLKAEPEEVLTAGQQLFRRICTLMSEQQPYTDEGLNRDGLAQLLGTNGKYIDQAIHDCSHGETTSSFINRYRLEHVARLLKTTDEPIGLIGEMAGIPSRTTLARLFRNTYGMTCSEFRQAAKSKTET